MSDTHLVNTITMVLGPWLASDTQVSLSLLQSIIIVYLPYIMEGMRRDETRDEVMDILSQLHPLWMSREKIDTDDFNNLVETEPKGDHLRVRFPFSLN